jgi:hygromycin-B 7''-O-kinase
MAGRLSVGTPRLIGAGSIEGWPYTVMTCLPGVPMNGVWPGLDKTSRVQTASQLGAVIREWHDATAGTTVVPANNWSRFVSDRIESSLKLQRSSSLSDHLMKQISAYLSGTERLVAEPDPAVLLHADFKREHILMSDEGGKWRISGLIDFGDAMHGHAEYDFIKATHSLFPSDRDVLRAFFTSYGESGVTLSRDGSERMLRWALLHFDTPVAHYMRDGVGSIAVKTLSELSAEIWPLE